jgi:hypothetical protein
MTFIVIQIYFWKGRKKHCISLQKKKNTIQFSISKLVNPDKTVIFPSLNVHLHPKNTMYTSPIIKLNLKTTVLLKSTFFPQGYIHT